MSGALRLVPRLEEVSCPSCGRDGGEPVDASRTQMAMTFEPFTFVRCSGCQLVRLSPRPSGDDLARYYDASYLPHRGAKAWGRYAGFVERSQRATDARRVRIVERVAGLKPNDRVLDVGCGKPTFLAALRDRRSVRGTGIDFVPDAWTAEPERWQGLDLRAGSIGGLALEPGFDAITMWHSLEHDVDPVGTLRALRGLARRGAALVVEVPDHDALSRKLQGGFWGGYHTPRHTVAFTSRTLVQVLEKGGWRVERTLKHGTMDPYVLWWLGREEQHGRSLCGSLEGRFWPFVVGKVAALPLTLLQRWVRLGVQLAVARA